jgi:pyrroline-5-carboxylate reductase
VPEAKFDAMAVVGGIAVAFVVMLLHRFLFGVPATGFSL